MEKYRYRRLSRPESGAGEFRLLILHRGCFDDPVNITISIHSLDALIGLQKDKHAAVLKWWALSYTWGDLSAERENVCVYDRCPDEGPITPDGMLGYVAVTRNLIDALRHIREDHVDRCFWVDAICIDQSTDQEAMQERAWQVQSMHHIYAHATGVIVWLGLAGDDSEYALQTLQELGSSFSINWSTLEYYTNDLAATEAVTNRWKDPTLSSRDRLAVGALVSRPWFERVWIRQEAFFANEQASGVFCGHSYASLAAFRKAVYFLDNTGLGNPAHSARVGLANAAFERSYTDIPGLLRRIRFGECKDQRDRIYAMLGIIGVITGPTRAIPITVDYSEGLTPERVYRHFFFQYTKTWNTLGLLDEAGLWQRSELRPSWVPDWRSTVAETMLSMRLESATSHFVIAEYTCVDEKVLRVFGRTAGLLSSVHRLPADVNVEGDALTLLRELTMIIKTKLRLAEERDQVESLSQALWCVVNPAQIGINDMETLRQETKGYLSKAFEEFPNAVPTSPLTIGSPEEMLSENAAGALKQSLGYLQSKKTQLLFMGDRYLGIGPRAAEPGDHVYAILGCRSLMLLRKTEDCTFQVVGPCFIHGFNWGESILGPLPDGHTVIHYYEESRKCTVPHYLNSNTGTSSMWDPRVAWDELEAHPPMVGFVPVIAPPGEPFRVRPDSSYLKRHDVELEEVDLV